MSTTTTAQAGARLPVGDDETSEEFTRFVEGPARRLRLVLIAHFGPEVGNDAASHALSYAWQHWSRVKTMTNPVGYLYRVGQSAARRDVHRQRIPRLPPVPSARTQEIDVDLPRALARLSAQQRVAVVLVHAYGWTLDEASIAMEISVSTLRNHLNRGLHRLRRLLEDHDD